MNDVYHGDKSVIFDVAILLRDKRNLFITEINWGQP